MEDSSLVPVVQPGKDLYLDSGSNWRASSEFHGSPGRDGAGPDNRVVFNEILSNSDPPEVDVFELFNTQGGDLDIGGWFVSDDAGEFKKYRIADNTVLPAGGLLTFDASEFNNVANAESLVPFALSGSKGDDLYLLEPDATGNLLRFIDRVEFGAAAAGESFGRWPDGSSGELYPMTSQTFGLLNESGGNAVRVGSLVIAEIHYNPDGADEGLEFITICNAGEMAENLANWKLRGEVDFDFSAATSLGAGAFLVLVDFDPTDAVALSGFQSEYGLDPLVPVLGPWTNDGAVPTRLNDGGGSVRLLRPDALVVPGDGSPAFYPMLIEDLVNYDDVPPWPLS
ncbi:MAG: lamin tail domain-containing protein, partial [Verrucomicrobiota bacterium]|nr:lamin tail domain-containing protein [Verrucomicrobiota bacterium]